MKHLLNLTFLTLTLVLCVGPTIAFGTESGIYTVDVEKALSSSKTAQAGQAHLQKARKALEAGFEQLRQIYDQQPEAIRQQALSEGAATLSRQLSLEQEAVKGIVAKMMLEEIRAWRESHGAMAIIPRQNLLDAAKEIDITDLIISAMDAKTPKFPDLPVVSVEAPQNIRSTPANKPAEENDGKKESGQ